MYFFYICICICISKWIAPFWQTLRQSANPRSHAANLFLRSPYFDCIWILFVYISIRLFSCICICISKWITHFGQTLQLPVPRRRPFLEKPIQIEAAVPPESLLTSRSELDLRLQLWLKQQQGKHPHQRKSLLQILSRRFQQAWDHLIVVQQQDDGPSAFELTPVNQLGRVRSLPSGKPWK